MHIMLIDESKSFRQLASIVLKTEFSSLKMDAVEDTEHAIRLLRLASYKLIVIDVTLLNTSGCDILDHLNQRYPDIPVLVTSAMGIDHAVLKAFDRGVIGHVNKELVHDEFPTRIQSILNSAPNPEPNSLSSSLLKEQTSKFSIPNERHLIMKINNYVAQLLKIFNICSNREQMRVLLALEEALVNAICHGNLEVSSELRGVDDEAYTQLLNERCNSPQFNERRVEIRITVTNALAKIRIRDQGPGFDTSSLPDPREEINLGRSHGRGVLLMRSFMDEVHYNETGNEVTMIKYKTDHANRSTDSAIWTHVQCPEILELRAAHNQ